MNRSHSREGEMQPQHDVEELFALAYKDDLTGLYNRRYFNRVIAKPLEEAPPEQPYCLFMMDIDFFKDINDTYGHKNGDQALIILAEMLMEIFQGEETPIRFAGDEFIVFMPRTDLASGLQKARELVEKGRELIIPVEGNGKEIRFTLSVGVADFPEHGNHWEEVIEKADQALYVAKQEGRNRAASPLEDGAAIQRGDDLSSMFPCPGFIDEAGSAGQIAELMASWTQSHDAPSFSLLCQGGRGSGKTRLVEETGKTVGERGIPVLSLTGTATAQEVGFGSLVQGLLRKAGSAEALRTQVSTELQEEDENLWQAFFSGQGTEQHAAEEEGSRKFFRRILKGLAGAERSLVLLVDDAELLDPDTRVLVRGLLGSRDAGFRCFTVLASRSAGTNDPSADWMSDTLPERTASRTIQIAPLNPEGVNGMVQAIFPTLRVTSSFYHDLAARSGGNPLYVEEALKLLIQRGILVYKRSAWTWQVDMFGDLPDSLDSLLAARLDSLEPEVRDLLKKASVMGPEIDPELLKEIGGGNEGYLMDLLEQARKSGILTTDGKWQEAAFTFNSRDAQRISYDGIPEGDRIAWHLELAKLQETMGERAGHLDLGSLLHHYRMAGRENEFEEIRKRLDGLGTAPAIVSGPQRPLSRKKKGPLAEPEALSQQHWAGVLSIFHLLRAAVQTWRLYPETSQAVSQSCNRLLEGFQEAFAHTQSVHLSEAEGTLLVNGEAPSWKGEEKRVTDNFCRSLSAAGLKDISFGRGLTLEEIKTFLRTWIEVSQESADAPARWEAFETGSGVTHIQVNAKVYVAVSETALFSGSIAVEGQESGAALPEAAAEILTSLQDSITRLQSPDEQGRMEPDEAARTRALLEKVQELLASGSGGSPETAGSLTPDNGAAPPPPEPGETAQAPVPVPEKIEEQDVRCWLADILSGDTTREARGYRKISEMGTPAVEPLYFTFTQTEDAHEGRICARFLASLCPDFAQRILRDLNRPADPLLKKRLLQYGVPALENPERRKEVLAAALQQEDRGVAAEALHLAETGDPQTAPALLLEVLPGCPARTRMEIYACLGRLGDSSCVPQLLQSLDAWKKRQDEKTLRGLESTCEALGHFSDPEILEKLQELLIPRKKVPWGKSVPANLRKAALKTMLRIGGEPVAAILKEYEADKDPWIRLRARSFVQGQGSA
jgi:diguanylate cyclase (GGDEF)-like protein